MDYTVDQDSMKGLLSATRAYVIPRFQREYSWSQIECDDYIEDMISQLKQDDLGEINPSRYFLGVMIFQGRKDDDTVEVVDGQQRLTTATILLAAIRDTLIQLSGANDNESEKIKSYAKTIQNEYIVKDLDGSKSRKLRPKTSCPYFDRTIQKCDELCIAESKPITREEELIKATYERFLKSLSEDNLRACFKHVSATDSKNRDYLTLLIGLRDQILKCGLVCIYADNIGQATTIFANINSKGKPLTSVDLIKCSIFGTIGPNTEDDDQMADLWRDFLTRCNKTSKVSFEKFFVHFWRAKFPEDKATTSNLYDKYLKRYRGKSIDEVKDLVNQIDKALNLYIEIVEPKEDAYPKQHQKYEYECLLAINEFRGEQVRVPLLALRMNNISPKNKQKEKLFRLLANIHFAAFGMDEKMRSNMFTSLFYRFAENVQNARDSRSLHQICEQLERDLTKVIDRDIFLSNFKRLRSSKKDQDGYSAKYAIHLLADKMDGRDHRDDVSSVEHVIDENSNHPECQSIGNLIVLETNLNEHLGTITKDHEPNEHLALKLPIYKQSGRKMTRDFADKYEAIGSFGENDIQERSEKLAEAFWDSFFDEYC